MEDKKPIILWPGEEGRLSDGRTPVIYLRRSIFSACFGFILGFVVGFIFLWSNIPFLPLPTSDKSVWFHLYGFINMLLGQVSGLFRQDTYWNYAQYMNFLDMPERQQLGYLFTRWGLCLIIAVITSIAFFKMSFKPVDPRKHIRGKKLLSGKVAYQDLYKEFSQQEGSGLILGSFAGFNPSLPQSYIEKEKQQVVELPEDKRRAHSIYIGSTGRAKTHTIYTHQIVPIYHYIRTGEMNYKLLIVDTPKADYLVNFHSKDRWLISPENKGSVSWDLSKDLSHRLRAEAFWKGVIPESDKDKIWSTAARLIGTGTTSTLIELAPGCWNYGMQAAFLTKQPEQMAPWLNEYYPEAKQVIGAAADTIKSVMFNLTTYAASFIELARIWDGYDIKKMICQSTAQALKHQKFVEYVFKDMFAIRFDPDMPDDQALDMALAFKGTVMHLNKHKPDWKWLDFSNHIKGHSPADQYKMAAKALPAEEGELLIFENRAGWTKLCGYIINQAQAWDEIEARPKLSLADWIKDESPSRKIVILKPSETFPTLTEGLIRGMLYFANSVILGELKNSPTRKFQILIDELQSNGNIDPFLGPALALYRSKGVGITLAFQDLSQLKKLYGDDFVKFLNSNVANIFLMGVNQGATADQLSDLVGKREIQIRKSSESISKDGKSTSSNFDTVSEQVITADEINTYLGVKEYGKDKDGKPIKYAQYLYLGSGLSPAYILKNRIYNYKTRHEPKPATWTLEPRTELVWSNPDKKWSKSVVRSTEKTSDEYLDVNPMEENTQDLEQEWIDEQSDDPKPKQEKSNRFLDSMNKKIKEIS